MEITDLIGNFGFPIAITIVMFYFIKYMFDVNNSRMEKKDELHKAEVDKMTAAINNNTKVMIELMERISNNEQKSNN